MPRSSSIESGALFSHPSIPAKSGAGPKSSSSSPPSVAAAATPVRGPSSPSIRPAVESEVSSFWSACVYSGTRVRSSVSTPSAISTATASTAPPRTRRIVGAARRKRGELEAAAPGQGEAEQHEAGTRARTRA